MLVSKYTGLLMFAAIAAPPLAHAAKFADIYDFAGGASGSYPLAELTPFAGAIYGTAGGGNSSDNPPGIFRLDPTTNVITNTVFPYGFQFFGSLLPYGHLLYGTAESGPTQAYGLIFSFNPATGALTPVYSFKGGLNGAFPIGELAQNGGVLYGATVGGSNFHGTLFSVDAVSQHQTVLHRFNGTNGDQPGGVTYAFGALFGMTYQGGAQNQGEVFRYDLAARKLTVLHSFSGGADGGSPVYSGITAAGGALYGVTRLGGVNGAGAVFRMDPYTGAETVLYSFTGGKDGASPICKLIATPHALYGTTNFGGTNNLGTVFRTDIVTGATTILHEFAPATSSPIYGPNAGLALFSGALFGVRTYNGTSGLGEIFKLAP
jgi:uncharacterized repeat protein (TIGR03803 family)